MTRESSTANLAIWLTHAARMAFYTSLLGSSVVLLAWPLDCPSCQYFFDGLPAMKFSTALALVLLSLEGLCASRCPEPKSRRIYVLATFVLALSSLLHSALNWDFGLETLFVSEFDSLGHQAPGMMSSSTALMVCLLALGTLCRKGVFRQAGTGAICSAGVLAVVAMISFVIRHEDFRTQKIFATTSVMTAQIVALLSAGFLANRKSQFQLKSLAPEAWKAQLQKTLPMFGTIASTLLLGITLTTWLAFDAQNAIRKNTQAGFHELTSRLRSDLNNELSKPVKTLKIVRRFYAASDDVTDKDFADFARGLGSEEIAENASGIGFIKVVPKEHLREFIAQQKAIHGPDFKVNVFRNEDVYFLVQHLYPRPENLHEWPSDMGTNQLLRDTLEEVRNNGDTVLSDRVKLRTEEGDVYVHLLAVPVYQRNLADSAKGQSKNTLNGILYIPLQLEDVFQQVVRNTQDYLDFRVYECKDANSEKLIYSSPLYRQQQLDPPPQFSPQDEIMGATIPFQYGGRRWEIRAKTTSKFSHKIDRVTPVTLCLGGNLVTLLVCGLVWSLSLSRSQALGYAAEMTADLRASEEQACKAARDAEEAKRDAQRKSTQLQMVIEGARDHAIVTLDVYGRISSWNDGAKQIVGYDAEDILGKQFSCLYPESNVLLGLPEKELAKVRYTGRNEVEGWRLCKDGSLFWANVVFARMKDLDGGICGFSMILRDLTEKRRSEVLVKASVESAPLAMAMVDSKRRIVLANVEAERLFGYSRDELLGEPLDILLPDRYRSEHPRHVANFFANPQSRQMGAGRELFGKHKNGTEVPVEIGLKPVETEEGLFVLCAIMDITERKQAEERATSLSQIIKESPNEIYILDQETLNFMEVSEGACSSTGYAREELLSMTPLHLSPSFGFETLRDALEPLADLDISMIELQMMQRRKNGDHYPVQVKFNKSCYQGRPVYVAFINDLTKIKQLESRLVQAQKLESIGQLAAGVAHEINTPMQFLNSNVEFLQETTPRVFEIIDTVRDLLADENLPSTPEDRLQEVDSILDSFRYEYCKEQTPAAIAESIEGVQRIVNILHAMKLFSHPGKQEKTHANVNELITSATIVSKNRWKYSAELELDLDEELPKICCYPAELNQVLLNLIVNASDAITETRTNDSPLGKITLRTCKIDEDLLIECQDTGVGIPEEIRRNVFDSFFTTKEVGKGTGQGLAISYDIIVNKHGGTIEFDSVQGQGTTFRITLPFGATLHRDGLMEDDPDDAVLV